MVTGKKKAAGVGETIKCIFTVLLVGIVSSYGGRFIGALFLGVGRAIFSEENKVLLFLVMSLPMWVSSFLIAWAAMSFFLKNTIKERHTFTDDKKAWLKSAIKLFWIPELVRFLYSTGECGLSTRYGIFSLTPTDWFELTYLTYSGRMDAVRQDVELIFADYAAYTACYAVYFAIYFAGVLAIYRYLWKKCDGEKISDN
ncbi:MAG: hypothetical protein E7633_03215 [Ruminococcaceae bacterium]|nr:hypothetical protein [Oscillospiraceae bacterium]